VANFAMVDLLVRNSAALHMWTHSAAPHIANTEIVLYRTCEHVVLHRTLWTPEIVLHRHVNTDILLSRTLWTPKWCCIAHVNTGNNAASHTWTQKLCCVTHCEHEIMLHRTCEHRNCIASRIVYNEIMLHHACKHRDSATSHIVNIEIVLHSMCM